ncbi:MAG: permease [Cyanobacteria bacterium HKST-UBA03]|nr:permease [Cyanobacteria bacterium HKST-UBA03]
MASNQTITKPAMPVLDWAVYPKRALLVVLAATGLLAYFWLASRYPALWHKAHLAGGSSLASLFTLNPPIYIYPEADLYERILWSTFNWLDANKLGMTFGIIFGALVLTLLDFLKRPATSNALLNSAFGLLMGAPLGVCANCAAPIAKGMLDGGSRQETALATMLSSPTFNAVVLIMLFSLFPWWMGAIKVGLSAFFILVVMPGLVHRFRKASKAPAAATGAAPQACTLDFNTMTPASAPVRESWPKAFQYTVRTFLLKFGYILMMTVPLMFLAGLTGAVLEQMIDLPALVWGPTEGGAGMAKIAVVALLGTSLPMPIAMDMLLADVLFRAGVSAPVIVTLLFTLGLYSVYSFLIVMTSTSKRLATALFVAVAALGAGAGWLTMLLQ